MVGRATARERVHHRVEQDFAELEILEAHSPATTLALARHAVDVSDAQPPALVKRDLHEQWIVVESSHLDPVRVLAYHPSRHAPPTWRGPGSPTT